MRNIWNDNNHKSIEIIELPWSKFATVFLKIFNFQNFLCNDSAAIGLELIFRR